jgi:signal peptidase I
MFFDAHAVIIIMRRYKNLLLCIFCAIIIIIPLLFFTKILFFVNGISMLPTLRTGDILYIDHLDHDYKIGDIIVFRKNDEYLVKRIVHISGYYITQAADDMPDTHTIYTYVSDKNYQSVLKHPRSFITDEIFYKFKDQVWVQGDNKIQSENSEFYGAIKKSDIIGKVASIFRI